MKKAFICSPYRGNEKNNVEQADKYCKQAIDAGFIPIAPHTIFPNFMDDSVKEERKLGIEMGLELMKFCSEVWVFGTPTEGMKSEIAKAEEFGITLKFYDKKGLVGYDSN